MANARNEAGHSRDFLRDISNNLVKPHNIRVCKTQYIKGMSLTCSLFCRNFSIKTWKNCGILAYVISQIAQNMEKFLYGKFFI